MSSQSSAIILTCACLQETHDDTQFLNALSMIDTQWILFDTCVPEKPTMLEDLNLCSANSLFPMDTFYSMWLLVSGGITGSQVNLNALRSSLLIFVLNLVPLSRSLRVSTHTIGTQWSTYPADVVFFWPETYIDARLTKDVSTWPPRPLKAIWDALSFSCRIPTLFRDRPVQLCKDGHENGWQHPQPLTHWQGFTNMPMTKLRDFKSRATTVRDLGDPQATTLPYVWFLRKSESYVQGHPRIQYFMTKHPTFCSILKQRHDEFVCSDSAFAALDEIKNLMILT